MIKQRLIFLKVYTLYMSKTQLYFEVFRTLQNPFISKEETKRYTHVFKQEIDKVFLKLTIPM